MATAKLKLGKRKKGPALGASTAPRKPRPCPSRLLRIADLGGILYFFAAGFRWSLESPGIRKALRTSNNRKPSKPAGERYNEPSGGLVQSAGCSGKKDGQSYMTTLPSR